MTVFRIKKGDLLPEFETTLVDNDGVVDLTDGQSVKLILQKRNSNDSPMSLTAAFVDKSKGKVKYVWSSGDTDTIGYYDAEWEVTFSGSKKMTFPNNGHDIVEIYPDTA